MFAHPRPRKSILPPPSKKRKTTSAIEEINFDFDARADYLTGFHKRKVQRVKKAQEEAAAKERAEKLEARKAIREERKRELEEHVNAVNMLLKKANTGGSDAESDEDQESWDGFDDDKTVEPVDHEEEYVDEDKYTTVTIEEVDVSRDGLRKVAAGDDSEDEQEDEPKNEGEEKSTAKPEGKAAAKKEWPKKKKKKFRYEPKAVRKVTVEKQRSASKARAESRKSRAAK